MQKQFSGAGRVAEFRVYAQVLWCKEIWKFFWKFWTYMWLFFKVVSADVMHLWKIIEYMQKNFLGKIKNNRFSSTWLGLCTRDIRSYKNCEHFFIWEFFSFGTMPRSLIYYFFWQIQFLVDLTLKKKSQFFFVNTLLHSTHIVY